MQESEISLIRIRQCMDKISIKSKYQTIFIVYMCFVWFQITFSAMIPSYIYMNPLFECNQRSATETEACSPGALAINYSINQNCRITNNFTATYEVGLYCENKQSRSFIQSIFAFGALVGMFGLPVFGDLYGRRLAIIFSYILQMISIYFTITGIYQNYVALMVIGSFLNGVQCSGLALLTYIITGQFCKNSYRQRAILLYSSCWGLGQISFYFLYNYRPEWNFYVFAVVLIPSVVLMILSFFLIQSPQYCLVMAKDIKKFSKNIDKLSKYNESPRQYVDQIIKLGAQMINSFQKKQEIQKKASFTQTMGKIIKNKLYIRTVLCLALTQISYNIFYYGVQGSLERTGYNFGFSMLIVGIHQFLAYLTTSYIINKIRRKKGLIIAILFTSVTGLSFLFSFVNDSNVLQSIVISVTRIGCVYAYSFLCIIETESFPAQIKSTAIGLTVGLSQCGRIAVPYIITAMNDIGINPLIASSIVFLSFGILPLIPVKETFVKQEINQKEVLNYSSQESL